jgi:hypothetical protein
MRVHRTHSSSKRNRNREVENKDSHKKGRQYKQLQETLENTKNILLAPFNLYTHLFVGMRLFLSVVISRLSKASLPAPRITSKASLLPAPPTHRLLAPRKCPSTAVTRSRRILRAWSAATTAIPPTRKQTLQLTTRNTPDRARFRLFRKDSRRNQCKNSIIAFLSNLLQGRRSAAGSRHRPNTASWKLGNVLPEWRLLLCRSSEKNLAARRSTRTDS